MKPYLVTITAICLLISGCNVSRTYGEQIMLSDGTMIHAELESVVGPDEFLQPGFGPTKKIRITFKLPKQRVVWPGEHPGRKNKTGNVFPIAFDVLDSTPVVVLSIVNAACPHFGNPPNSMIAYSYDGTEWKSIPFSSIPLTWRRNLMGDINNRFLVQGYTYSLSDKAMIIPTSGDGHQITLGNEIERYRKLNLLCSQRGS